MAQYVYSMNRVGKIVPPKREILKDISLSFFPGAKIGVLGLNGSGKSTLLRIMAGEDKDYIGEARPMPNMKVGYLPQEPELDDSKTVREIVEESVSDVKAALDELDAIYAAYAEPDADFDALAKKQGELENLITAKDGHNLDNALERAADALRLPPWDAKVAVLSGGERRRVALCRLLLDHPDMLLLDEPTNHLDAESIAWIERFLQEYPGTVVAITHDRYFLDNAAGWILELDRGRGIPYEGNYSSWLEQKDQRLAQESKQEASHNKAIQAELEWVRQGAKGRQAKSKARLKQFEEMNSKEFQKRNETQEIYIPPGPRLGDKVIELHNVTKSYGDKLLFEDLSLTIPPGAIVGIIGPNGAGKSTLFRMITGEEKPDSGEIEIGSTVQLAYVNQARELDGKKTVFEEIADGADMITVGNYQTPSRAYCGRFNFKGSDQQKYVKDLSGGERNRLHMAKLLKEGGNVLLLDEPTNDLDVETLRALEEAILAFPGSAVVISHDRWFLDRVCTHMIAYEGDSSVVFFEGNYSEYAEDYLKRYGKDHQPERIKYRRMN
ncbi:MULTISPECIES: energy-dependent translational throttle protein EttA [unclassified Methylophaga]|mgnify:FL=1|jgi:energy-dependent translational throttle protein EttA|uniref:Energy-dependent translational throttle protein EttA n=1 Tax=Pseudidiomarina aestuarii TaxID=624146 RepID=A0A2T4CYT1_9GAMM|nr:MULTISPECIES: energy-dependent translational throttle protein EttA [unclassified Methylophaga]PTB86727.1 energy-dependent translational throttle protein EttA [Pseudidiomarina aestuarii]MAL48758.1 energy-dependent translational throttle protein EttA [Methylophaga sp.]MAP25650.1 energy-dependent translational throttle protein EttA [Methylophaga sp.]MBP25008.1 energy-dependent translational throttle protein EttA [Methylophaga sp.]MDX1748799.1 energy-dependent translational throttle protein Ett